MTGITLAQLAEALGGRASDIQGNAPCPLCQPEARRDQHALSMRYSDRGVLWIKCFRCGAPFPEIRDELRRMRLWPLERVDPIEIQAALKMEELERSERAKAIWQEALPIQGTAAEHYLRLRGIDCPLPETLRYHPNLYHGETRSYHPAMVAFAGGGPPAIHRTYLTPFGLKASVGNVKMALGPVRGGWVPLRWGRCTNKLIVAEGIENAMSLMCGFLGQYFGNEASVWATLSASGLAALRLPTPDPGDQLIVAPDPDPVGLEAARQLAASALGWQVRILPPPNGKDWNQLLGESHG